MRMYVSGVTCSRCVERVRNALAGIPGVTWVTVEVIGEGRARAELVLSREIRMGEVEEALEKASQGTPHRYSMAGIED